MTRQARNRPAGPTRSLGMQGLERRECLAAVGFAEQPIGGHLLGGSSAMTVADLNGDRHLDFISTRLNFVGWRANDGQGNFGENRLITRELENADHIIADDVDGDGDNDVVAISRVRDEELAWFENRDGLGSFGPKRTIATIDDHTWAFTGGDLDGDGDLDLVRSGFGSSGNGEPYVEWLENVGSSAPFQRRRISDDATFSTIVVDLDRDGDRDIVTDHGWLENVDGHGQFRQRSALQENEGELVIVSDLDNNGRLDLLVTSVTVTTWYEATDDPTVFSERTSIRKLFFDPPSWYLADVDGDGDRDLLVVEVDNVAGTSSLSWYELVGDRYVYREAISYGFGGDWSLIVADVNGDSRDDVLYYSGDGLGQDARPGPVPTNWYSYQEDSRTLTNPIPINEILDATTALVAADVDGDGDLDVINTTVEYSDWFPRDAKIAWIENLDGSGALGRHTTVYADTQGDTVFRELWPNDIDGDGDTDIVAATQGTLVWFENLNGKGNFGGEQPIADVASDTSVLVDDFDNDGRLDLLVIDDEKGTVDWYWYDDPRAPWTSVRLDMELRIGRTGMLLAGDLDGDGDQDLVFSEMAVLWNETTWFQWFEHLDGRVAFAAGRDLLPEVSRETLRAMRPQLVSLTDFDGDSDLDVWYTALQNGTRALTWLENRGDGQFAAAADGAITVAEDLRDIVPADLDDDGDVDIVAIALSELVWFENVDGHGTVGSRREIGRDASEFALADFDADGDTDIVAVGFGIEWFENRPVGDANGDDRFDAADLMQVLAAGRFEDDVPGNADFSEGDWDGDGDFTTADLVAAFAAGHYIVPGPPLEQR